MQEKMPQEIEVRYILPAIRRELARILVEEKGKSQKKASKLLDVTEAAISQYLHMKRAKEVIFSPEVIEEIRKSADILTATPTRQRLIGEMYRISNLTDVRQILCGIHRSQSKDLESCNVCFEEGMVLQVPHK
ncbi:hypothetical protein HYU10_00135 [Candidatus Woesearchaeota archaeon]|nr:hypothetical protein [Candidatus Woesearchaeota archaeon]MBI2130158.1 hypothetical protein [Candidatus Woesearchaeota archaeon]